MLTGSAKIVKTVTVTLVKHHYEPVAKAKSALSCHHGFKLMSFIHTHTHI